MRGLIEIDVSVGLQFFQFSHPFLLLVFIEEFIERPATPCYFASFANRMFLLESVMVNKINIANQKMYKTESRFS